MKKRIGSKLYDTDTAILVDTLPDGIQVYRKKNSPQFFMYNPNGKDKHEMFFELPPEQTEKYLTDVSKLSTVVKAGTTRVMFSPYDAARIKNISATLGMSMSKFLLSLVDEYEKTHK